MKFSKLIPITISALLMTATAGSWALAQDLKISMEAKLTVLDPILSTNHASRDHGYMIYDTLLALDADQKIQPQMLETYSVSPDGLVYKFTLRDGLKWHDGAPVTTADVIASIDRWSKRDRTGGALMKFVSGIEAKDDKTFTVTLTKPTSLILSAFANPSGIPLFIMPERVAKTPPTEAVTDYTGSGPFVFEADKFQPGVQAIYHKNKDYKPRAEPASGFAGGKVVNVDKVERIEFADPVTAVNALVAKEIDYLQTIPVDLLPLVPTDGSVNVMQVDMLGYQIGYRFNNLQPPFNNKKTRQAAVYAIGQEAALQAQFGTTAGFYTLCGAAFGCGLPYENDVLVDMVVPSNIEKAKELLKESGYNGEKVVLFHVTDLPTLNAVPLVMAQQLRDAGFTVELQAMDFQTMLSRRANKGPVSENGWSIFVTNWHATEIEDPIKSAMVSAKPDGYAGWADVPEIEAKTQEFILADSQEKRVQLAKDIQGLVYDNGVFAPIGIYNRRAGVSSNVSGVIQAPANLFWNISKK